MVNYDLGQLDKLFFLLNVFLLALGGKFLDLCVSLGQSFERVGGVGVLVALCCFAQSWA